MSPQGDTKTWAELNPTLPCRDCCAAGFVEREGFIRGCDACRGLGRCFSTMKQVKVEYVKLRKILCKERGMTLEDVDERARRQVDSAKKMGVRRAAIWVDVLFCLVRDLGLLENYWAS